MQWVVTKDRSHGHSAGDAVELKTFARMYHTWSKFLHQTGCIHSSEIGWGQLEGGADVIPPAHRQRRESGQLETLICGRLIKGAYFGPQYVRLKDTAGNEKTTTILSHGLTSREGYLSRPIMTLNFNSMSVRHRLRS
jgi:hypothetical protein